MDYESDKRQVTTEEGKNFSKEKKYIFKEISAKEGTNINDLFYIDIFDQISKKLGFVDGTIKEEVEISSKQVEKNKGNIVLSNDNKEKKKKKRKCNCK